MDLPKRAGDGPIAIELKEGSNYAWCTCGLAETQPLCDGKHRGTDMLPTIFTAESSGTKYLCACKATGNDPFCDGSHKS